nr:solute carrier family 22 member 18 isoform X2 [Globicephala melas]
MRVRRPGGGGGQPPGRGGGGEFIPGGWVSQVPRRGRVPEPCSGWARPELTQEGSPHQDGAQADPYEGSLLFRSLRGLPATPAQDAGSQGLQGPGLVPQQDWHSGPVPGHVARVRAGSPGARLPLHAVLSHAIPVPEAGPGLCCLRLPADHLWRASAVGRARVWQRSTCSWLPPAARPCPACPYSLPRACPAPSCTRCQVGPAAQMAITDLSAPEERPAALGRLGLCFGVGVIFGSLLGGTLSSTCGIQCPVIVALVVSLLGAVLSLTCIPTSTKGASAHAQAALPGKPKASVFDLKAITCLLLQPGVLPVFLVKVICGFPSAGGRPGRLPHVLLQGPPDGRQLGVARPVPQGWARPVTGRSPGLTPAPGGAALNPLCPGHFLSAWWRWQGTRSSRAWSSGGLAAASPREPCSGPACWRSAWWDWPWNHAGPLRLCAATDQNPGAHPGRPPVPPLRSPRFRPRAARRQLPHAAGPLEAACAPKDGQSLVTVAPRHRLAINSLRTSSRLISISWAGGLGTRAGWSLGCWRASWRRGPAAVPQGSRESRITQVHPSGRWVLPPESATKASEEYPLLPPRQLCPRRSQRQGAPCSPLHTPHPTPTPGLGSSTCCPHTLLSP